MDAPDPITRLNASLETHYRIERELREGGMATVYLAEIEATSGLRRGIIHLIRDALCT